MKKKTLAFILTVILALTMLPLSAMAVTGSVVAADGSYSGSGSSVGTITVTVSNGKITNVTCSKATKSSYATLVTSWLNKIKGKEASVNTIDAVAAATSGKYGSGLKEGTLAALKTASAASGSSGSDSGSSASGTSNNGVVKDGSYSGAGSNVGTITVTVSNGKITNVACSKATKSSYQKLVTTWLNKIKGQTASVTAIDAISAATSGKYGSGLKEGTLAALKTGSTESSSNPTEEEDTSEIGQGVGSKTGTKYTGTGTIDDEYITLDVYVSNGKITGLFIVKEEGTWLNLLTQEKDNYIGKEATTTYADAITSATSLGFRTALRDAVSSALKSAETDYSDTASEIGQGVGSKTGTKYTGTGTIDDEYITLDVYVSNGKITGLFIVKEEGTWLNLLTQVKDSYIGKTATSATVDAITSSTSLGFRDTIRNAVSNALKSINSSSSSSEVYKADGWDKEYSYNKLKAKQYYYLYQGTYYPITPVYDKKADKDKPYAAYIMVGSIKYYLDKADKDTGRLPTKWNGEKTAKKTIYESAKSDDDAKDKAREPQLYTKK